MSFSFPVIYSIMVESVLKFRRSRSNPEGSLRFHKRTENQRPKPDNACIYPVLRARCDV